MKCDECGTKLIEWDSTPDEPYHFEMSGLKDVYLSGIKVLRCKKCKSNSPIIPRIVQLHDIIARTLVDQPELLSGDELRFLRKHAGLPANKFAALLEVDASHLSRVENGKTRSLGRPADKLARVLAMEASEQEYSRNILLTIADQRIQRKKHHPPVFKLVKNKWRVA